jgi:hypothetical protein
MHHDGEQTSSVTSRLDNVTVYSSSDWLLFVNYVLAPCDLPVIYYAAAEKLIVRRARVGDEV